MQRQFSGLYQYQLELKYIMIGTLCMALLVALSASSALMVVEDDLIAVMEAALGLGLIGLFLIAFTSNLAVIVNIPFMLVALPWVVANPTPGGIVLFSLATGVGAGLGKLIAYVLAVRVASRFETLSDSPLHRWISTQIEQYPRFAPLLVFIATTTILPLDPALMPLLLVGYSPHKVALPLLTGKIVHSLSLALVIVAMSASLGMGGGLNIDLTVGVVLATLLLVGYQVEKARQPSHLPESAPTKDYAAFN